MSDHITLIPGKGLQVNTPAGPVRFRVYEGSTIIEVESHNLREVIVNTGFFYSEIDLTNDVPKQD